MNNMLGQMDRRFMQAERSGSQFSSKLVGYLNAANEAVASMAAPVRNLVALANPAKARMFDIAAMDASAVVGRELIPVLDAFTRTARKVGDTVAGFEPVVEPAMKAVADLVDDIGTGMREAAIECEPEIRLLTEAIVTMAKEAGWAARHLGTFASLNFGLVNAIDKATGGAPPGRRFDPRATSRGAAAQEARFVGAKELADEAIKNAMTLAGTGQQRKTQEQTLQDINKQLADFFGWAKGQSGGAGPAGSGGEGGDGGGWWLSRSMEGMMRRAQTGPAN
jgi:hypothetical protein